MLLENNPFPQDIRVHNEAVTLVEAGYRVTVLAPRAEGQPRRATVDGVDVRRFPLRESSGGVIGLLWEFVIATVLLQLGAIRTLVSGADALHLHNPPDTLFAVGWVARLLRRAVVFDHHDLTPELVATRTGSAIVLRIARFLEARTFRVASLVVSSNESYARIAHTRGGKPDEAVVVVRNGPREDTLTEGSPVRPGRLADPHLVYVGAVAPQDGVEVLPSVLAFLRDSHGIGDARLTIVGTGPGCEEVRREASRHSVADRVRITGWLDHGEVQDIVREADICVDPAPPTPLNDHSTMIKIAEYLAAGRPVVAYDLTETGRTAGSAACLVEGDDPRAFAAHVAALAEDESLRVRLAAAARDRAPALTWERSAVELLGGYATLLGDGRSAPGPSAST